MLLKYQGIDPWLFACSVESAQKGIIDAIIISATGVTPRNTIQTVEKLFGKAEGSRTLDTMQKVAILATKAIVWKVLGETYL